MADQSSTVSAPTPPAVASMLESAPTPILFVRLGRIESFNPAFSRLFGYLPHSLSGLEMGDILAEPADVEAFRANANERLDRGEAFRANVRVRCADGSLRWALIAGQAVEHGRRDSGSIWTLEDDEDRHGAGEALRASEERYRLLFESNPHPMWVSDLETMRFISVNDAALARYGYTREEFATLALKDVRSESEYARLREHLARPRQRLDHAGLWRHRAKSGEEFTVDVVTYDLALSGRPAMLVLAMDVTERERHLAQIRRSEQEFRTLADNAHDVILRLDRDHRVRYVNPAASAYSGLAVADMVGRRTDELPLPPGFASAYRDVTEVVFETGKPVRREIAFPAKDGAIWFDALATPEPDPSGGTATVLWIGRDVTEQRRALEDLAESEARYRALVETSADGIAVARPDGSLVLVNGRAARMFGPGEPASFRGQSFLDFLVEADRPEAARRLGEVLAGGQEAHELRAVARDGRRFPVEVHASAVPGPDGKPGLVIGILRDITERKATEAQLRLLAKVFTASRQGVVITDATPVIVAVNQAFSEITGYAPEEAMGRNPSFLSSGRHDAHFYGVLWAALAEHGHWAGEVWNRRKDGEVYPESLHLSAVKDDAGRTTHYVALMMDVTERKETEARIRHLAQHDLLTDLPNRALLRDRAGIAIARAQRSRTGAALLFLDLDHFKAVNDSLGHLAGDGVLQELARRLALAVRGSDTVCRLGGDEFVVLLADLTSVEDATRVAGKMLEAAARPFLVEGREVLLTASVGIGIHPENGADLDTLLRNADAAMYAAKAAGRHRFAFYSEEMNTRAIERYSLENDLRRAIERGQLSIAYQRQVSLADGRETGTEALLRWHHPELGAISPGRFIPIAEDSGLILPIGAWVLREACRQARSWLEAGISFGRVAVNVSALQIRQPDFTELVREALAESALPGSCLEIEVTESVLMDAAGARERIEALGALGVRIAIDDFGTGFSSLSYLRHFPLDRIKIDQSFVRDLGRGPQAARLLEGIIQLGHSLGFGVLAEGVETAAEASALAAMGCDDAQGYHFGRPGPARRAAG